MGIYAMFKITGKYSSFNYTYIMNKKLMMLALGCIVLSVIQSSCSSDSAESNNGQQSVTGGNVTAPIIDWPLNEAQLTEAQPLNDFALRLTHQLWHNANGSIVASPLSMAVALSMVIEGAEGETRDEVVKVLGFAPDRHSILTDICASILHGLSVNNDSLRLEIANSCCVNRKYSLYREYSQIMRNYYDADVSTMDFYNAEDVANLLNEWCKEHTKGMIPQIISKDEIDESMVIFWLNAIYFKGLWSSPFPKGYTQNGAFQRMDGSMTTTVLKPMMHLTNRMHYLRTDAFAAVELPYCGSRFVMTAVLPHNTDGFKTLLSDMTAIKVAEIKNLMKDEEVELTLPRFSVESSFSDELKTALQDMGVRRLFSSDRAQITNVSPETNLYVSLTLHKARLEVNEEGTEAAAATLLGGEQTSSGNHTVFSANRPFLFYVTDRMTDLILFTGIYNG